KVLMSTPRNSGNRPVWLRRTRRAASALGLTAVFAVAGLSACADSPTAPTSAPPPAPSASLFKFTSKLLKTTLNTTLTTTQNLTTTLTNTTTSLTGTLVHGLLWTSPVGQT